MRVSNGEKKFSFSRLRLELMRARTREREDYQLIQFPTFSIQCFNPEHHKNKSSIFLKAIFKHFLLAFFSFYFFRSTRIVRRRKAINRNSMLLLPTEGLLKHFLMLNAGDWLRGGKERIFIKNDEHLRKWYWHFSFLRRNFVFSSEISFTNVGISAKQDA